jgi:hypothetical protein
MNAATKRKQPRRLIQLAKDRIEHNESLRAHYEQYLASSACPEWQRADTAATIRALIAETDSERKYLVANGELA